MARKVRVNVPTRIAGAAVKKDDELIIDDRDYALLSQMERHTADGLVKYVTALEEKTPEPEKQVPAKRKAKKKVAKKKAKKKKETATSHR